MGANGKRCKFHVLEWETRWRCSKPAGHEHEDPNGVHSLIPEAVSPGSGEPAAGGGSAPPESAIIAERRLDLELCDLLDRAAIRLIQTASGKYLKLDWILRALGKAEALRVRLRTMSVGEMVVIADMLYLIAPRHAEYLAWLIESHRTRDGSGVGPPADLPGQTLLPGVGA